MCAYIYIYSLFSSKLTALLSYVILSDDDDDDDDDDDEVMRNVLRC